PKRARPGGALGSRTDVARDEHYQAVFARLCRAHPYALVGSPHPPPPTSSQGGSLFHPRGSLPYPSRQSGLYDPSFEHDACGVAFVARLDGEPSHETVERALNALANLEHRGAAGADKNTGDGAGILVRTPDAFFRGELGAQLPPAGAYAVGTLFGERADAVEAAVEAEGQRLLCWRDVPIDDAHVGRTSRSVMPRIRQFVVASTCDDQNAFERKLYVIRRVAENAGGPEVV